MKNKNLQIAMLKKEETITSLAKKMGMKRNTLYVQITKTDLFERPRKIAEALGVELKDII